MMDIGPTKFGDYVFPYWADALGWTIGASTIIPFVVFLLYRLIKGPVSTQTPYLFILEILLGQSYGLGYGLYGKFIHISMYVALSYAVSYRVT